MDRLFCYAYKRSDLILWQHNFLIGKFLSNLILIGPVFAFLNFFQHQFGWKRYKLRWLCHMNEGFDATKSVILNTAKLILIVIWLPQCQLWWKNQLLLPTNSLFMRYFQLNICNSLICCYSNCQSFVQKLKKKMQNTGFKKVLHEKRLLSFMLVWHIEKIVFF